MKAKVNEVFVRRQAMRFQGHMGASVKVHAIMPEVKGNIAMPLIFAFDIRPDVSNREKARLESKLAQLNGKRFGQALRKACIGSGYNEHFYGPVALVARGLDHNIIPINTLMIEERKLAAKMIDSLERERTAAKLLHDALTCEDGPQLGEPLETQHA